MLSIGNLFVGDNESNSEIDQDRLDQAKKDYTAASDKLEKTREVLGLDLKTLYDPENPESVKSYEEFTKALDNLIDAGGYDTETYNHNTIKWQAGNGEDSYIHVNNNADLVLNVVELGKRLDAKSMIISEGFRSESEYNKLYSKAGPLAFKGNQHYQQNAADVTFYKSNNFSGLSIDKFTAAKTAATITGINGIGTYDYSGIVHIDMRPINKHYNWYRSNNVDHQMNYAIDPDPAATILKNGW